MRVVIPKEIVIVSTNIAASTFAEWAAGTYATGAQVKDTRTTPHMEYTSNQDGNTDDPVNSSKWDGRATNQWRMFDSLVMSQTEGDLAVDNGAISVTFEASKCDHVGLLMLYGQSVTLDVISGGETVYTTTVSLEESVAASWYEYLYRSFSWKEDVVIEPTVYLDAQIKVTVNPIDGEIAKCGHIVPGAAMSLGSTQLGARPGIVDYSIISENQWGETYLAKGNYAKTLNVTTMLEKSLISRYKRILDGFRATPLLWIGYNDTPEEALVLFGFYREAAPTFDQYGWGKYEFEIKGMI